MSFKFSVQGLFKFSFESAPFFLVLDLLVPGECCILIGEDVLFFKCGLLVNSDTLDTKFCSLKELSVFQENLFKFVCFIAYLMNKSRFYMQTTTQMAYSRASEHPSVEYNLYI